MNAEPTPRPRVMAPSLATEMPGFPDLNRLFEAMHAERLREATAIESAIMAELGTAGITKVVRQDPVEQVAAEPVTLAAFIARFRELTAPCQPAYGMDALLAVPLVPDPELPPGHVHLRPHLRPGARS